VPTGPYRPTRPDPLVFPYFTRCALIGRCLRRIYTLAGVGPPLLLRATCRTCPPDIPLSFSVRATSRTFPVQVSPQLHGLPPPPSGFTLLTVNWQASWLRVVLFFLPDIPCVPELRRVGRSATHLPHRTGLLRMAALMGQR
jgi:hypothetical protein